ncbi:hypothetical protein QRX60_17780 [Amycolatopsis mongoliensis]|uniref:Uncharacterized protein n=1 Tax=Amycolatopsis mongoliensis TaxID=715475 RepID=A0A9Y2JYG7_9PSEU|nr:hypothetical protein [Amycolatopsis sp. 4-36]WIY05607.1 hypothetical protein QRX60_17780 [Amycolatopsis sp. 4-36]
MTRSDLTDVADLRSAGGHPDLVLAGAMLSGVVTPQQADLVSEVSSTTTTGRPRPSDTA